ncbi:MAG TPA: TRAP transporter large permease subunit [Bdellovibrionales bacterium]|nr:TRAP transporter large permease subunit [Bdellovibrionales bacterium]
MQLEVMLILGVTFTLLLILGSPISVAIALSSFLALLPLYDPLTASQIIGQKIIVSLDNFGFLAIPFFILAGLLMNSGGIARRLIELAKVIAGPLPGALDHCTVIANMLFGAVSGSAVASAAAVGSAMGPLQKKEGYDPAFSAAVNIASCPSGLIIPPSGALILYALITGGTSITALFVAGYIPGILMGLSVMAVIALMSKKHPKTPANKKSMSEKMNVVIDAIPSLFLIVFVMGGMIAGIFTATEASAASVIYALILGFIYRELKVKALPQILTDAIISTSVVLFLVGASTAMGWVFSIAEIPEYVAAGMLTISNEPWVILLMMNIILLIMGTFLDLTPAILIFTPIFFPVATQIGVDPVHFGIIMVFNNCIGIFTPPVGSALFVGSAVSGVSLKRVMPHLWPMFWAETAALLLVTFVPSLSLWLPRLAGLVK